MIRPTLSFYIQAYEDCLYQIDFCLANGLTDLCVRYYRLLNYIENRKWNFEPVNEFKNLNSDVL